MSLMEQRDITRILGMVVSGPRDLDKWEIAMSPDDFQSNFGSVLAVVRLASHVPRKKKPTSARDKHMSKYFLLAETPQQIWVRDKVKGTFFRELKAWRTVQPAKQAKAATYGNLLVPVSQLVHCLDTALCTTMFLKAYGQKLPLVPPFFGRGTHPETDGETSSVPEPAPPHPRSHYNLWDIGKTFKSSKIFLFAPAHGACPQMSLYPMVVPASLGYGSVLVRDISWHGDKFNVKVYPRLVHTIKSINSRIQGDIVTTLRGVKRRVEACSKLVSRLEDVPAWEMGGYRIEVTVSAGTLKEARDKVQDVPFWDLQWWMSPISYTLGTLPFLELAVKVTTKQGLLDNARWMSLRAESLGLFTGDNNVPASRLQKQAVADLLASVGWNAGRRQVTDCLSPTAWWLEGQGTETEDVPDLPFVPGVPSLRDTTTRLKILSHLTRTFSGRAGLKRLLAIIKESVGYVPCQRDMSLSSTHKYWVRDWSPLRLTCMTCNHNIFEAAAYKWFAQLVDEGHVPQPAVGMGVPALPHVSPVPGVSDILGVLETASPVTVSHLSPSFMSKTQIKDMLGAIKACPLGHVPCMKNSRDNHQYLAHGWKPFRLRCNKCKHNLTHSQSLKWIAVLVDRGDVPRETVGLPPISPVPESPHSPPPTVSAKHLQVRRQRPAASSLVHVPSLTRVSPLSLVPLSLCPSLTLTDHCCCPYHHSIQHTQQCPPASCLSCPFCPLCL